MTEQEIKQTLADVQRQLEKLQNEKASFLFIGNEGNYFTISGNAYAIMAQILFAMMRYPVVHRIIKYCADNFEEVNSKHGKDAKNVELKHLIEKYSGGN